MAENTTEKNAEELIEETVWDEMQAVWDRD